MSAIRRNTAVDRAGATFALFGICMPNFLLALLLIFLFGVTLRWLPISGYTDPLEEPLERAQVAGAAARSRSGSALAAVVTRTLRSSLLEALAEDYVRTARAKGLSEWRVIWSHVLKNALIPVVTVLGLQLGTLIGGAVITEYVFALPGVGRLVVDAVFARDYPLVQGVVLLIAIGFILSNLIVDVLYGWIDPAHPDRAERARARWKVLRRAARARLAPFGAAVMTLAVLIALAAPLGGALRSARPEPRQHTGGAGPRPSPRHGQRGTRRALTGDLGHARLAGGRSRLGRRSRSARAACSASLAGYCGGRVDGLVMRVMDAVLSFPPLVLAPGARRGAGRRAHRGAAGARGRLHAHLRPAHARSGAHDHGARLRRRGAGAGRIRLARSRLDTWCRTRSIPIIVQASLSVAFAILAEASLSFLGLGIQPPQASWGSMINAGRGYLQQAPWIVFGPGAALFVTVVGLSFVGDAVRDALDPAAERRVVRRTALSARLASWQRQARRSFA